MARGRPAALGDRTRPARLGAGDAAQPGRHLKPVTLGKCAEGYGRWLGFLAYRGLLDPTEAPEQRVTEARIMEYLDLLLDNGNAGHTIYGRLCELKDALRILAPAADLSWLLRPGGIDIRGRLDMTPRHLAVHHPQTLYRWGLELMEQAVKLSGPRRRQVMLRDGLMIALFAARAMRLRSQHALGLETQVRRSEGRWWIALGPDDVKTGRPIEYPAPDALQRWIERYVTVERVELLAGKASDAFWINWGGQPLGERGIEKRIRWHSTKKFGPKGAFGAAPLPPLHRLRRPGRGSHGAAVGRHAARHLGRGLPRALRPRRAGGRRAPLRDRARGRAARDGGLRPQHLRRAAAGR